MDEGSFFFFFFWSSSSSRDFEKQKEDFGFWSF